MKDEFYMRQALDQAKLAYKIQEVPVGAVVVDETGKVISKSHNLRETMNSPSAHAEFLAIEQACRLKNSWRLTECSMYVTLEPCIMCAGLMHQTRIKKCIFGAYDKKCGALVSLYNIAEDSRLNHNFEVVGGIMEAESAELLQSFFKERRS